MSAVTKVGENSLGIYYSVAGSPPATVRHSNRSKPFVCLRCVTNACDHIEQVTDYLSTTNQEAA